MVYFLTQSETKQKPSVHDQKMNFFSYFFQIYYNLVHAWRLLSMCQLSHIIGWNQETLDRLCKSSLNLFQLLTSCYILLIWYFIE